MKIVLRWHYGDDTFVLLHLHGEPRPVLLCVRVSEGLLFVPVWQGSKLKAIVNQVLCVFCHTLIRFDILVTNRSTR